MSLLVGKHSESEKYVWIDEIDQKNRYNDKIKKLICDECKCKICPVLCKNKANHFRHHTESNCRGTSMANGMTPEHLFCQELIRDNISKIKLYECKCKRICYNFINLNAQLEKMITDKNGKRCYLDVAVSDDKEVLYAFEVEHTHKVDYKKKQMLNDLNIKMVEAHTSEILNAFYGTSKLEEIIFNKKLRYDIYDFPTYITDQCDQCKYDIEQEQKRIIRAREIEEQKQLERRQRELEAIRKRLDKLSFDKHGLPLPKIEANTDINIEYSDNEESDVDEEGHFARTHNVDYHIKNTSLYWCQKCVKWNNHECTHQ